MNISIFYESAFEEPRLVIGDFLPSTFLQHFVLVIAGAMILTVGLFVGVHLDTGTTHLAESESNWPSDWVGKIVLLLRSQ